MWYIIVTENRKEINKMKTLVKRGRFKGHTYEVYKRMEHYELYIDGEFWSSGDNLRGIEEELENAY